MSERRTTILVGLSSFVLGVSTCLFAIRLYERKFCGGAGKVGSGIPTNVQQDANEQEILDEQLSRGLQFFGEDGQEKINNSFVVVVGAGGVGSNCAHFLARAGVRRIRVIDFDNVTLSSLNRHAVATRKDVGIPKVTSLRTHLHEIIPECVVEDKVAMFTEDNAEELLQGKPDYVVDCIDDRNTKVQLLAYCLENGLKVLTSMGAGCKSDPTKIHFAKFKDVIRDPLAQRLRWNLQQYLKQHGRNDIEFDRVEAVYSSEEPVMKLLPLDAEVAGEDPSQLGTVPNFRVRILPVLGTMPALFGIAMAARVLTEISEKPFYPVPRPSLKLTQCAKYLSKFRNRVTALDKKRREEASENDEFVAWELDKLDVYDVETLFVQFVQRCCLYGSKMGDGGKFELTLWRYDRPVTPSNMVLCSDKGLKKMEEMILAKKLPNITDLEITPTQMSDIAIVHEAMLTSEQRTLEQQSAKAFDQGIKRAVAHMNKDHLKDNLTMVKAYGGFPDAVSATMISLDRRGMTFDCTFENPDQHKTCRVLFPSRLIEPKEMRETVVKLTLQGRELLKIT